MQKVYIASLIATGVCVVILCVGTGLGIANRSKDNLNETVIEYEAYDNDYVDYDSFSGNISIGSAGVGGGGVIRVRPQEEGTTEMESLSIIDVILGFNRYFK